MTPFKNEPAIDFNGSAVASAEADFTRRKKALRDVSVVQASKAAASAKSAFAAWSRVPVEERSALLIKTAELLRKHRAELTALILVEVHKNWREADADFAEAVDFLEYYAREAVRIAGDGPMQPLGVVAVIAPWNFPLAILCGMTAAALATGNAVLMKPAEQAGVIAGRFFEILNEAVFPKDLVHFLPGPGETVGDFLVNSPEVDLVCFTGSKEVGMSIASKKKRVIAEMGGKNALLIDESADVSRAVEATISSAFGFQGQKCSACSRVLPLPPVYDEFRERLVEAVLKIRMGDAKDPENFMGPVIDAEAEAKIRRYIALGESEARLLVQGRKIGEFFVPPTVFESDSPGVRITREEIFGPVVALLRPKDFNEALAIANSVPYDLTGGIFSSNLANIERAKREFDVGNLYINRKITGALVACQPFGGYRLSSLGSKAGGPDYLYQFLASPPMPEPPEVRKLPSVTPEETNELVSRKEGPHFLVKTICERITSFASSR